MIQKLLINDGIVMWITLWKLGIILRAIFGRCINRAFK